MNTMLRASEFHDYKRGFRKGRQPLSAADIKAIKALVPPAFEREAWYIEQGYKFQCSHKTIQNIILGITHSDYGR